MTGRQLPEPWFGNIENAKVLFLSSNPSIDTSDYDTAEDFPVNEWDDQKIGSWHIDRVDPNATPMGVSFGLPNLPNFLWRCRDNEYRGQGPKSKSPQKTWNGIHQRALEIIGQSASPSENYALTEIVHCKSINAKGVKKASSTCADMWLQRIIAISSQAKIVVLVGSHVRDLVRDGLFSLPSDFGTNTSKISHLEALTRDTFVSSALGRPLLFVYLPHPTSFMPKTIVNIYGQEVQSALQKISNSATFDLPTTEDWIRSVKLSLNYSWSLNASRKSLTGFQFNEFPFSRSISVTKLSNC